MCRAIFPYELGDPDFAWLLATFQESHPGFVLIDSACLPLTLVAMKTDQVVAAVTEATEALGELQELARELPETTEKEE